jgi:hypothetical protein
MYESSVGSRAQQSLTHANVQGVADEKVNREKEREKAGDREVEERKKRE